MVKTRGELPGLLVFWSLTNFRFECVAAGALRGLNTHIPTGHYLNSLGMALMIGVVLTFFTHTSGYPCHKSSPFFIRLGAENLSIGIWYPYFVRLKAKHVWLFLNNTLVSWNWLIINGMAGFQWLIFH